MTILAFPADSASHYFFALEVAMRSLIFAAIALSLIGEEKGFAQSFVVNGSFELPSIPSNTASNDAPTSWTKSGNQAHIINGDFSSGYPLPQNGAQYVGVGNGSALSQAFQVNNPGTFLLSWQDSSEFNDPIGSSPYSVSVLDGASNVVRSETYNANAVALRVWAPRSLGFSLSPGSYTLRFQGNVPEFGALSLIDNVKLIPEPSSALIVLASIWPLATQIRKRRLG